MDVTRRCECQSIVQNVRRDAFENTFYHHAASLYPKWLHSDWLPDLLPATRTQEEDSLLTERRAAVLCDRLEVAVRHCFGGEEAAASARLQQNLCKYELAVSADRCGILLLQVQTTGGGGPSGGICRCRGKQLSACFCTGSE